MQAMSNEAWAAVTALIGLFSGVFGKTLLDRWFDREGQRLKARQEMDQQRAMTSERASDRAFIVDDAARAWLREQLDERDEELRAVRSHERELMIQVADLAAAVARQEERSNAQARRIDDLSAQMAKLGADYAKMEAERDSYRDAKHDLENKLTPLSARLQLAEREVAAKVEEIERLRGQLEAALAREGR